MPFQLFVAWVANMDVYNVIKKIESTRKCRNTSHIFQNQHSDGLSDKTLLSSSLWKYLHGGSSSTIHNLAERDSVSGSPRRLCLAELLSERSLHFSSWRQRLISVCVCVFQCTAWGRMTFCTWQWWLQVDRNLKAGKLKGKPRQEVMTGERSESTAWLIDVTTNFNHKQTR